MGEEIDEEERRVKSKREMKEKREEGLERRGVKTKSRRERGEREGSPTWERRMGK
jgi:hypothetical protein